jgi:membrane protease YdiL (CAAX protease family)
MWKLRVFSKDALIQAPQRSNRLSIVHVIVVLLVYIISALVLVGIMQAVGYHSPTANQNASADQPINSVDMILDGSAKLITLATILLAAKVAFTGGISGMGLTWRGLPRGLGIGIIAFLLLMPPIFLTELTSIAINLIVTNKPPTEHPLLEELQNHPSASEMTLLIFTACVIAPIVEEIFFRGLLQTWLCRLFSIARKSPSPQPTQSINWPGINSAELPADPVNPLAIQPQDRWLAIFITAAIFACVHFSLEGATALAPLFVLAVGLGYVYERTGNIWTNITMHACFNTLGIVVTLTNPGN